MDDLFSLSFEFGATVLGSTFETAAVLSSCHCRLLEFGTAVARRLEQALILDVWSPVLSR